MILKPRLKAPAAGEYAIYIVNSSRINVASFNENNMDYFIGAMATVLDE